MSPFCIPGIYEMRTVSKNVFVLFLFQEKNKFYNYLNKKSIEYVSDFSLKTLTPKDNGEISTGYLGEN